MQFTCNRQDLTTCIANVSRAVSGKSSMPALEGILIKAYNDKVTMYGYNLELGIWGDMEAVVQEEGELILNARHFSDICRRLPSESVSLSADKKQITSIKSGKAEFSLIGIAASEYPELPFLPDGKEFTLDSGMLSDMIGRTLFSIAASDVKPIWTGTYFEFKEDRLRLVSVDGYRMAIREEPITSLNEGSFIIPGRTLQELTKFLEEEKEVHITAGKKHVLFEVGDYTVITRLIEGEFVNYEAAIPKTYITELRVTTADMIDSVERASVLITERLRSPIKLNITDDCIGVSCVTAQGKVFDETGFIKKEGDNFEIGFNNKYLLDALRASGCDEVKILLGGPEAPIRILPPEGEHFIFVVVPISPRRG